MDDRARPGRIVGGHHVGSAPEGADREATADDLAEGGEIGPDAEVFLHPAIAEAESDDLVEDQEDAALLGHRPEAADELRGRRDRAAGAHDRLDDHRREFVAVLADQTRGPVEVVVAAQDHFAERAGRKTGRSAVVGRRHGHGHLVVRAVVATLHFHDLDSPGKRLGRPKRKEGGLGAGVAETKAFDRGDPGSQHLRQEDLKLVGGPVNGPLGALFDQRLVDLRMGMAVEQRGEVVEEVEVLVPVGVPEPASLAP